MMQINSADEIELINRSSSYTVSKSLFCAKIPFFNELWSSQVERQIQFDLSEPCFETLINWVYSDWIVIHGSNFLSMFIVSDHLGIKPITSYCSSFIKANYSAKQIAAFITNKMMDSTISQNYWKLYLRLINGEYFLEFPLEVVKNILSLDLSIETEFQVFQAIMKWIKHDQSRGVHLQELMKCIRWCYTFKDCYLHIKEDEFIVQNLPQLDELACEPGECRNLCLNSRIKEKHLISLYFLEDNIIGMSYSTGENYWEPCGSFVEDDQIPFGVISEEHVVDVIFDSGRTGIRFDLVEKKYRWLKMSGLDHYNRCYDFFKPNFGRESSYGACIQDEVEEIDDWVDIEKNTLIVYNGEMNIIGYTQKDQKLFCFLPDENIDWFIKPFAEHRIHAYILNGVCYIITKSLTFRIFDMVRKTIEKSKPFDGMNLTFEDLQLDSHESNVILLIKSQKKIMMFDTRKKGWTLMGQIYSGCEMITLTTTYIPAQFIKKLYTKKSVK
ncbi:uncharacterized protein LOC107371997 [Tetranychus urticae]|nr:uncharacterized protein LOC107371997 [Tetranychus urticae]